mgnify:CR=1 FL=1
MEKLLELQFLDILPTRSGFLFVRREILDETQIRLSFHEFLLHTREEVPVRRSVYLRRKFGAGYETLVRSLATMFPAIRPGFRMGIGRALSRRRARIFFKRGPAGLARGIDLSRSRVSDLAVDGDFFWSAVPEQNAVICFSTATKRIALRISGGTQRAFDGPCSLVRYGRVLYVCNERSHQISTLSLDRYAVRDYQHFQEPVYKFFRWQKEEIAVLASGVYLL